MERARFLYSNGYRGREGCIICFLEEGRISPGGACGVEREHVGDLEQTGGREIEAPLFSWLQRAGGVSSCLICLG